MSNKDWYLEDAGSKPSLYGWIFQQMAVGASYAAILLFGLIALILIIFAIGQLLPEDSKTAPAPMPQIESSLTVEQITHAI